MSRQTKHWILYDARACGGVGTYVASVLVSCDSDEEARSYGGHYGEMACYSYDEETEVEQWEWDWLEGPTPAGSRRRP